MLLLYNLAITCYTFAIRLAAFFRPKARKWVAGRKGLFSKLQKDFAEERTESAKLVWVHCASLGEFEQGRPIIELLKEKNPSIRILLTFFSPSGYEIRHKYSKADYVFYLPADTASNARNFLEICQPDLAIFVKYEFWYHYLNTLAAKKIPTLLVAARFRSGQIFFRWYGALFRRLLSGFQHLFLQDEASAQLLDGLAIDQYSVVGDPRIDRVLQIAEQAQDIPIVEAFASNHKIGIVGSSWSADEQILARFLAKGHLEDWKFVIAPHEIHPTAIQQLHERLPVPAINYSKANLENCQQYKVLIIDNIGMLSALYKYGRIAYIGGGFGAGIHNTLEPIAFGLPVIFGPKYQKFEEAVFLVKQKGGFCSENEQELERIFVQLEEEAFYKEAERTARRYLQENKGASRAIVTHIEDLLENHNTLQVDA